MEIARLRLTCRLKWAVVSKNVSLRPEACASELIHALRQREVEITSDEVGLIPSRDWVEILTANGLQRIDRGSRIGLWIRVSTLRPGDEGTWVHCPSLEC